ncbi:MAG: Cysteine-tRNA ligase [Parcubacteria group bacterium GW2011_GWA2_51_10]|nr:MAG: Cysteine-tRNA ligase [Parcubacteria group bacterium GW2011_GWA2_51_10]
MMAFSFFNIFRRRRARNLPLYLYNTLGGQMQKFSPPPHAHTVRMYNCGPTVYDVQHIGNLSMFVFTDALRRTLEYNGFQVKQTINFTDVGHLAGDNAGDADEGEDRMTKGLKREGLPLTIESMRTLGERYSEIFIDDLRALNIDTSRIAFPRASDYISLDVAMIATLEEKGYAYRTKSGVYFDTARFPNYGKLGNINLEGQKEGARIARKDKRSPSDFILWKLDEKLGWESPWGRGFPGWHIECSAMIRATLGQQIDIHTGGIEHIPVHHNNEIAQSEAVTGRRPLSKFWMHRAHIQIDGKKISKSEGNVVYLSEITKRGLHPLALRYLFLQAHYRTPANFTWDALKAAQAAYLKLRHFVRSAPEIGTPPPSVKFRYHERFNDDLDTAGALAVIWEMMKDTAVRVEDARAAVLDADKVFGLALNLDDSKADALIAKEFGESVALDALPPEIHDKVLSRESARADKNWTLADRIRAELEQEGYTLEDSATGPIVCRCR